MTDTDRNDRITEACEEIKQIVLDCSAYIDSELLSQYVGKMAMEEHDSPVAWAEGEIEGIISECRDILDCLAELRANYRDLEPTEED